MDNGLKCPVQIFDIVFPAVCSGMQDRVERRGGSPLLSSERPPPLSLLPPQKHPGLHLLHHHLLLLTAEGATRWRYCIMRQPDEAGVDADNSCCRGLIHVLDQTNNHNHSKCISVECYKVMHNRRECRHTNLMKLIITFYWFYFFFFVNYIYNNIVHHRLCSVNTWHAAPCSHFRSGVTTLIWGVQVPDVPLH